MFRHSLYLIKFNSFGYDQYDSFLVSADTAEEAIRMIEKECPPGDWSDCNWTSGHTITYIGKTYKTKSILMESFKAG